MKSVCGRSRRHIRLRFEFLWNGNSRFFISGRANQLDGRRIKNRVIIYVEINNGNIAAGSALPPRGISTRLPIPQKVDFRNDIEYHSGAS